MPARKTHEDVENVYAAAERWVDAALRKDDSLFTPGKPIWSSAGLEKLRKRVLNRPDVEGSGFHSKLRTQLAESSPEVIQLMGEVLYAYFLSIWPRGNGGMKGDNKRARVNEVLAQSSEPAKVPNALADALDVGISGYGNALIQIVANVGTIIEFVEQWKEKSSPNEESLLNDPWAFKEFFEGLRFRSISNVPRAQREALFHLVFPDTFEGTVDVNAKKQIVEAKAFAHFVTEETSNVDRKIEQIRRDLEAHWGRDFDFFDEGVRKYWKPDKGGQLVEELEGLAAKSKSTLINESRTGYLPGLATQLFLPAAFLRDIETLLDDKKQVIFQGPPGTGKTYVAQRLANHLAGSPDRVTLVQFHPSYAYEDFVQGFRPTLSDGQAGFELRDGPLLRAAKRAGEEPGAKHFLIIDEINRGNLAKVFGELYYLLEYRDEAITLQYQADEDDKFSLPKNLYIIGTMNTADRSIARVDLALRRRFYFVEFHPDAEPIRGVLRRWLEAKHPGMYWVAGVVERANELLSNDRHAAIGPSYFMKDRLDCKVVDRIWKHSVLPYVEERLFGGEQVAEEFQLDKLKRQHSSIEQTGEGGEEPNSEDSSVTDASN